MKGEEGLEYKEKDRVFTIGVLTDSVIRADSFSKYFYHFLGSLFNILKKKNKNQSN